MQGGQVAALEAVRAHYQDMFSKTDVRSGLQPNAIIRTRDADTGWYLKGDQAQHLADFFYWTAWIAMGIFIAPLVSGREAPKQKLLVDLLFWALVALVGGSLAGEYLGVRGDFGENWFWFGHQGWEYLDLGRFWQIVLAVGLTLWLIIGFLMVNMGLVTKRSTLRALYFQLTILLGSGIIGTGHHYYWIGAPEMWIALGSVFSAMEVIPLTLLVFEAYEHYRYVRKGGMEFPYKWSFMFLVATAFWNLFGAGVLGFMINLPSINFFSHGGFLTSAHAHGALMGVYGMLGIALMLFCLRSISNSKNEKLLKLSFWGLNGGLMGMILITLLPVGFAQFMQGIENGYWFVRTIDFYYQPFVHTVLWLRMIPDTVFIVLGVVPLLLAIFNMWRTPRKPHEDKGAMTFEDVLAEAEHAPVNKEVSVN